MKIRELCAKCRISYYTYRARLKSGMDFFDALTKPVRDYRQNPTARRAKGVFYVPSTPCKACGTSKRYTKSRNCVFCAKLKNMEKYYGEPLDKIMPEVRLR